ncbi:cobalamin biosynthesis protein [Streptomyces sp. NPDC005271]|uniref:cobalamin biosynthesis protein n=1 Tax=unclassified Streptomyces TaxID=2593676 RepID=UPI0033AEF0B5
MDVIDQAAAGPPRVPSELPLPPEAPGPLSLVVGVGAGRGVAAGEVTGLIEAVLSSAGLLPDRIAELATVEAKAAEPGLLAAAERLGVPLRGYPAGALAAVEVPSPSAAALAAAGTAGVAEAAALLAAGPGGELLVPKRKSAPPGSPARATCAVARRPEGGKAGHGGQRRPAVARPDAGQ